MLLQLFFVIIESNVKFFTETYQLAKAAEDSIMRNLRKRSQITAQVENCDNSSGRSEAVISVRLIWQHLRVKV